MDPETGRTRGRIFRTNRELLRHHQDTTSYRSSPALVGHGRRVAGTRCPWETERGLCLDFYGEIFVSVIQRREKRPLQRVNGQMEALMETVKDNGKGSPGGRQKSPLRKIHCPS